jgi:hypothetical protein
MIPHNITEQHILLAIRTIDVGGVPPHRTSTRYLLIYDSKDYPPKYVISVANRFANEHDLDPHTFNGGSETNDFLRRRGFEIVEQVNWRNKPLDRDETKDKTLLKQLVERIKGVVKKQK